MSGFLGDTGIGSVRDVLCSSFAEERDKIVSYKVGETYSRASTRRCKLEPGPSGRSSSHSGLSGHNSRKSSDTVSISHSH